MVENFERSGFFEGVSFIFSEFFEYFKLFMLTVLNTFLISIIGVVPIIGTIASIVLMIVSLAFVPYGVTSIVCDVKIDFSIYKNFFDFLSVGVKKPIILQYLKIVLVVILIVLLVIFFVGYAAVGIGYSSSMSQLAFILLISIALIFSLSFVVVKMTTTLFMKIISAIYEDDDMKFHKDHASKYNCIFLWNYVPILNLISLYAICTVFAKDIKKYFEL